MSSYRVPTESHRQPRGKIQNQNRNTEMNVQVDIMERDDCGWVEFEEMYGLCRGGKVIWDDPRSVGDIPVITLTCAYHVLKWT